MTLQQFFKDWYPYVDTKSLSIALQYVQREKSFFPEAGLVFKAFTMCDAKDIKAVFIGQDPYSQKGVATGIAFGNHSNMSDNRLSPSLQVLKEAAIDYSIPHHMMSFDNTLEDWAKQGILMLNSSLTVKPYTPGSHFFYWKPFMSKFLTNFSSSNSGIAYVLFGKQAQSLKGFIHPLSGRIFEVEHPAAIARRGEQMSPQVFKDINDFIYGSTGERIQWFKEDCNYFVS